MPREVADGFHFAHFREAFDFGAHIFGAQRFGGVHFGHVEIGKLVASLAGRTALEDQRFVLREMLRTFVIMRSTSASASISARFVISVAQSSMESASSG